MDMKDARDDSRPSTATWRRSDFVEKNGSASLDSKEGVLRSRETTDNNEYNTWSYQAASRILWTTGMLSEPIPNGFYSIVPDKKLKERFEDIPTLEELHASEFDGLRADVILVDAEKDKKLSMLKQLILTLVKGLNSNPAAVIKKIAGLGYYRVDKSEFITQFDGQLSPISQSQSPIFLSEAW